MPGAPRLLPAGCCALPGRGALPHTQPQAQALQVAAGQVLAQARPVLLLPRLLPQVCRPLPWPGERAMPAVALLPPRWGTASSRACGPSPVHPGPPPSSSLQGERKKACLGLASAKEKEKTHNTRQLVVCGQGAAWWLDCRWVLSAAGAHALALLGPHSDRRPCKSTSGSAARSRLTDALRPT
jgi:hypothetical protein